MLSRYWGITRFFCANDNNFRDFGEGNMLTASVLVPVMRLLYRIPSGLYPLDLSSSVACMAAERSLAWMQTVMSIL